MPAVPSQAASAARTSRSRSCVSQVKPSPITWKLTSGKRRKKAFSPVAYRPLMNCTTPTRMPCPSARATMPKADELFPLPLPVRTSSTPRCSVAAAMRASTAAFRRCMATRWRAAGSPVPPRSSLSVGLATRLSVRLHPGGGVRALRERGVQQRHDRDVGARDGEEMAVPAGEARPPAREIRVPDAAAQPVGAPLGEEKADRDGNEEARDEPRQVERRLLVVPAQPGTAQPQHRVRRHDEPVGDGHAVVADAEVADGDAVDGDGLDEQRRERPGPFAREVEAAEK